MIARIYTVTIAQERPSCQQGTAGRKGTKKPPWQRFLQIGSVHTITLLETIHASTRIYQLLTAGKEGVALGADFNLELALYRAALEGFAASAAHDAFAIIGMDIALHLVALH